MSATMTARRPLSSLDDIVVVDWAEVGPLYYGAITEDGERPVLRPDRQAVIMLTLDYGEVYTLPIEYGTDFERAQSAVARIIAEGSVNLDKWTFYRVVYGSEAYVAQDMEGHWAAQEREEARWEGF